MAMDGDTAQNDDEELKTSPLRLLVLCPSSTTPATIASVNESVIPTGPLSDGPLSNRLIPPLLEALTSSKPSPDITSFSGYTSHPPLELRTQYYKADVGIWVDEVPLGKDESSKADTTDLNDQSGIEAYKSTLLSPEAAEVREVIGGIVISLPIHEAVTKSQASQLPPSDQVYLDMIQAVTEIRDEVEGQRGSDVASVVVLTSSTPAGGMEVKNHDARLSQIVEIYEEALLEKGIFGWDVVTHVAPLAKGASDSITAQTDGKDLDTHALHEHLTTISGDVQTDGEDTRNEYGEKVGIARLIEVLEAVEWLAGGGSAADDDLGLSSDEDNGPLRFSNGPEDDIEIRREAAGLSMAIRYPEYQDSDLEDDSLDDRLASIGQDSRAGRQGLVSGSTKKPEATLPSGMTLPANLDADNDENFQIDSLPGMMERVVAIREKAAGMSQEEKEKFARKEIGKIMDEL